MRHNGAETRPGRRRAAVSSALLVAAIALAGCGLQMPADPHGTEANVRGGTLRAGVTHNPPWTVVRDREQPGGSEARLVAAFAAQLDAEVEWTTGSEASLVEDLERGELDVVVGGFLDDTPWTEMAAPTRWYAEVDNERGGTERHVILTRMGENRFLVTLESFLDAEAP